MKKFKIIIPIIIVVITTIAFLFIFKNNTLNITNITDYLVQYENGDYYLIRANADIKFEVTSDSNDIKYKVLDENDKEVKTKLKKHKNNYVIVASKKYEAGKTYKLELDNASFVDEKLSDIKTLYFTITRPNSNIQVLNDDVIEVDKNTVFNITPDDEHYTIISNKEFNIGDILYYKNEGQVIILKVSSITKDNNNYIIKTSAPSLEETFKELDIYGEYDLKLNDFITNEELKDYIKVAIEKKGLLDNIIPKVKASNIVNIEVVAQKDGSAKITLSLILNSGEKTIFKSSLEKHNLKLEVELIIRLKAHSDITFSHQDIGSKLSIELGTNFNIEPTDSEFLSYKKELSNNDEINISLAKEKLNKIKKDDSNNEIPLVHKFIPISNIGLGIGLEIDFVHEFEIALESSLNLKNNLSILFGCNNKGFYKNIDLIIKASDYSILGKGEVKLGFQPKISISFMGVIEAGVKGTTGIYAEGQINYMKSSSKDEIDGNFEFGSYVNIGLYTKFKIGKITLYEGELSYERKFPSIELKGKLVDNCEDKLLKGDFSCYVGSYTDATYNSGAKMSIDKNGTANSGSGYNGTGFGKALSIEKRDNGSYWCLTKEKDDYAPEQGFIIYPAGISDNLSMDADSNKIRIYVSGGQGVGTVYEKDDVIPNACKEKILSGDFSCYSGTYNEIYSMDIKETLILDNDGTFKITKEYDNGEVKKYILSTKDISESNGRYNIKVESQENDTNYYTTGTFVIHPNEDVSIYYCDALACNQGYKKINK